MVIDADAAPEAIEAALTRLEALARARGAAIGVATALPGERRPHRALERRAGGARRRARAGFGDDRRGRPARRRRPAAESRRVRSVREQEFCPIAAAPAWRSINRAGEVFIGRRASSREATLVAGHEWQMPQGGIDDGEEPYAGACANSTRRPTSARRR